MAEAAWSSNAQVYAPGASPWEHNPAGERTSAEVYDQIRRDLESSVAASLADQAAADGRAAYDANQSAGPEAPRDGSGWSGDEAAIAGVGNGFSGGGDSASAASAEGGEEAEKKRDDPPETAKAEELAEDERDWNATEDNSAGWSEGESGESAGDAPADPQPAAPQPAAPEEGENDWNATEDNGNGWSTGDDEDEPAAGGDAP